MQTNTKSPMWRGVLIGSSLISLAGIIERDWPLATAGGFTALTSVLGLRSPKR